MKKLAQELSQMATITVVEKPKWLFIMMVGNHRQGSFLGRSTKPDEKLGIMGWGQ